MEYFSTDPKVVDGRETTQGVRSESDHTFSGILHIGLKNRYWGVLLKNDFDHFDDFLTIS